MKSVRLKVVRLDEPDGVALGSSDPLEREGVVVRWSIFAEQGCLSELDPRADTAVLERALLGDLQNFLAESGFGWGQLRLPPTTA